MSVHCLFPAVFGTQTVHKYGKAVSLFFFMRWKIEGNERNLSDESMHYQIRNGKNYMKREKKKIPLKVNARKTKLRYSFLYVFFMELDLKLELENSISIIHIIFNTNFYHVNFYRSKTLILIKDTYNT